MTKQVEELSAEAGAAATADAQAHSNEALRECRRHHQEQQATKAAKIRELERAVTDAQGKLHILEASVESLLDDQAEGLRESFKESEQMMTTRHIEGLAKLNEQHALEVKAAQEEKRNAEAAKYRAEHQAALRVQKASAQAADALALAERSATWAAKA